MTELIFILLIFVGAAYFFRSWFQTKTNKVISVILLLLCIASHPEVARFFVGNSDYASLSMAMYFATFLVSLVTLNKKEERINNLNLTILALFSAIIMSLITFDYYIGYYNSQIIQVVSLICIVLCVICSYLAFKKIRG